MASCVADTTSVDLDIDAGVLTAEVIVDPAADVAGVAVAPNGLLVDATGVYVKTDGWVPVGAALAYSSADGPTFVATTASDLRAYLGPGDRIRLTQTTVKYFIVTAIAAGTVTLYGGTDYVLANAAITAVSFSKAKSPIGFNTDPAKWTEVLSDTTDQSRVAAAQFTFYNPGSLSLALPIGAWEVWYEVNAAVTVAAHIVVTLSTANNTQSDSELTSWFYVNVAATQGTLLSRRKFITVAAKTSYFLNTRTVDNNTPTLSYLGSTQGATTIRARCAYL